MNQKGNNKNSLKQLLRFIDDILKVEGNDQFAEELKELTDIYFRNSVIHRNSILSNLHNHVHKSISLQYAREFYKETKLPGNIKEESIQDYTLMCHYWNSGDFENYCFSLYQQIEAITNYYHKECLNVFLNSREKIVYSKDHQDGTTEHFRVQNFVFSIPKKDSRSKPKEYIKTKEEYDYFFNDKGNINKLKTHISFHQKAKLFVFSKIWKKQLRNKSLFDHPVKLLGELTNIRNLAHRPKQGIFYPNQKLSADNVLANKVKYYHEFSHLLYLISSSAV